MPTSDPGTFPEDSRIESGVYDDRAIQAEDGKSGHRVVRRDPERDRRLPPRLQVGDAGRHHCRLLRERLGRIAEAHWRTSACPNEGHHLGSPRSRPTATPLACKHKVELLTDGKPDSPSTPWFEWTEIGFIDSGSN